MTARTPIGEKTGKGRRTAAPRKVREVESVACPGGGLHVLRNDARGRTYCRGCRRSWGALDAEVRAS